MININYIKTRAPFLIESHHFNGSRFLWEDYWREYGKDENSKAKQFAIFYGFGEARHPKKIISERQFANGRFFYQDLLMDKHGEHLNG